MNYRNMLLYSVICMAAAMLLTAILCIGRIQGWQIEVQLYSGPKFS